MTKYLAVIIGLLAVANVYLLMKVREGECPPLEPTVGISISPHLIQTINTDELPPHHQMLYGRYKNSKSHFAFVSMDEAKERGYEDEVFHVLHDAYNRSSNIFELLYLFGINNRRFCKLEFQSVSVKSDEGFSFRTIVVEGINDPYFEGSPSPPVLMIIYDAYTGEILNMGFYSAFY